MLKFSNSRKIIAKITDTHTDTHPNFIELTQKRIKKELLFKNSPLFLPIFHKPQKRSETSFLRIELSTNGEL